MYGHNPTSSDPLANVACVPDANGYYTVNSSPPALVRRDQLLPSGARTTTSRSKPPPSAMSESGGPVTLPDANIFTNGPW